MQEGARTFKKVVNPAQYTNAPLREDSWTLYFVSIVDSLELAAKTFQLP